VGREVVVIVRGNGWTVSVVPPVTVPNVADMLLVPAAMPVARPAALIVATFVFDEAHVTWAVRFWVLPFE
jgi:hypothetical protein